MKRTLWSLVSGFLNLGPSEGPHVLVTWLVGLFARISFGIGWTVMIVYFVSNYGVSSLPYLFIIHAAGMIFGSFLFSGFINRFKKEYLLVGLLLSVAVVLALASVGFSYNNYLFLGLVFVALSILHSQLKIVLSLFIEELFTPTQSNRVFPIVESSETVGIILGGLLVSSLSHVLPLNKFLYIWMMTILLAVPALILYMQNSIAIPFVDLVKQKKKSSRVESVKSVLQLSKKMKFIQSIILIVLLQWAFFSVLEFQFTKAVEQSVKHTQEHTLVLNELNEFGKASVVIAQAEPATHSEKLAAGVSHDYSEKQFEENFASDLGNLQMLFGGITLLFQLLLASRILTYLGVVGSMLISPIVLAVSIVFMTLRFGFGSAVVARLSHELAHVLHINAYHSSYYVLPHHMRANVKEFLEGFVRPMGAIVGTTILFAVTSFFTNETATLALNLVAGLIVLMILYTVLNLKNKYKEVPRAKLRESNSLNELVDAVLIVKQNGEMDDIDYMLSVQAERNDLPLEVEEHILETLAEHGTANHLNYLIKLIDERADLQVKILKAINKIFARCYDEVASKPFTLYSLRSLYQQLLESSDDPLLKGEVISFVIMSNYHEGFVDQIVNLLNQDLDTATITTCSSVLKDLDDHHIVNFLENFMDHEDPKVRSAIVEVMWSHAANKTNLNEVVKDMLISEDTSSVIEGLLFIANHGLSDEFSISYDELMLIHAGNDSIELLIEVNKFLGSADDEFYNFIFNRLGYKDLVSLAPLFERIDNKSVKKIFRKRVTSEIHDLYINYNKYIDDTDLLSGVQAAMLSRLRDLYKIIGAEKEYFTVEEILRS